MTDLPTRLEDARMAAGLTQAALARTLGISQPHYSKVVGDVVKPGPDLVAQAEAWLEDPQRDAGTGRPTREADREMRELARSIERQSRRLTSLLASHGMAAPRRGVRRARSG